MAEPILMKKIYVVRLTKVGKKLTLNSFNKKRVKNNNFNFVTFFSEEYSYSK